MPLTKDNVLRVLEKQESLTDLLPVEEFAGEQTLADQLASEFAEMKPPLKPTQLRKVFHAIKAIERRFKGDEASSSLGPQDKVAIRLLVPELAYACGRDLIPKKFYDLMRRCLGDQKLRTVGDVRRLAQFLTALLAYHKYHEKVRGGGER